MEIGQSPRKREVDRTSNHHRKNYFVIETPFAHCGRLAGSSVLREETQCIVYIVRPGVAAATLNLQSH